MSVTLTEVAEFRLRTFLAATTKDSSSTQRGVRISVKDGGCSGYEYALGIVDEPTADDVLQEYGKLRIYLEAQSIPLLEGVVVDFVEGLTESGFKFSNPNATETCGCGKSFKVGDCSPAGVSCS